MTPAPAPRRARIPSWLSWTVFVCALAVHFAALYWPFPAGPPPAVPHADKAVHVLLFAGVLWAGRLCRMPLPALTVALIIHAPMSELLQYGLLPTRGADGWDVFADLCGVALGLLLPWAATAGRRPGDAALFGRAFNRE